MSALTHHEERRLQALATAVCDETATAEQIAELDALVASSPEAALWYVRWMDLHFELHAQLPLRSAATAAEPVDAPQARSAWRRLIRPTPLSFGVAAAVLGLLVTAMAFIAAPFYRELSQVDADRDDEALIVAQVTGAHEAVWAEGQIGGRLGSFLTAERRLKLLHGKVELTFRNSAVVLLEGPCEFTVNSAARGTLSSGKLVARATEEAHGFVVETPTSVVKDLGTEFGVAVDAQGRTNVTVFAGSVEARPRGSLAGPLVLRSGETARIDPSSGVQRLAAERHPQFQRWLYGPENHPDSILRNGSFEAHMATMPAPWPGVYNLNASGNALVGWTIHGTGKWLMRTDAPQLAYGSASDGRAFLNVSGSDSELGESRFRISQRLLTRKGTQYVVAFDLAARPGVDGQQTLTFTAGRDAHEYVAAALPPATNRPANYERQSFVFTAESSTTLISIKGPVARNSNGFYLDNCSVVEQSSTAADSTN